MQPFSAFMNVESTRAYMDDLYSPDADKCLFSIMCIKNSVIGSNRQKENVLAQGIETRLLQLLRDSNTKLAVRVEAAVTIGSLAKGTNKHIERLIICGTIQVLLDVLEEQNQPQLVDACLCCLRTLTTSFSSLSSLSLPSSSMSLREKASSQIINKFTITSLQKLLTYAGKQESMQRQSCVANILSCACCSPIEQNALCSAGAAPILASLLLISNASVRIPAITCLANMCFNNAAVAAEIANTNIDCSFLCPRASGGCGGSSGDDDSSASSCSNNSTTSHPVQRLYQQPSENNNDNRNTVPKYLATLITRDRPIEMQLEAARCLTNLYRAGAITNNQQIITYKTLPCLVRICQVEHSVAHRALAADTLAYLTEVDSELQQIAAISNQLVSGLLDLLKCGSPAARQASLRAFASLGANDEDIRKRIIETKRLMECVVDGLEDNDKDTRLAAVRCLHSLSRSVQQLRTTFQDHSVWRPLLTLIQDSPCPELLTAASSLLCNLLLEFSPAKEPMLQQGVVQLLAKLTTNSSPALRLNGVWALMNLAFQTEQRVKSQILTALGTDQIFRLLADTDTTVLMKTLGLLRNLVSPRAHTDTMMGMHGAQVMQGVVLVLEGAHAAEVKEQALCILANIADGEKARDHIMSNEDVLKKLIDYMTHPATCIQEAAVFCIINLSRRGEPGDVQRQQKLKEMGVVNILQQLLNTSTGNLNFRVKTALAQFDK